MYPLAQFYNWLWTSKSAVVCGVPCCVDWCPTGASSSASAAGSTLPSQTTPPPSEPFPSGPPSSPPSGYAPPYKHTYTQLHSTDSNRSQCFFVCFVCRVSADLSLFSFMISSLRLANRSFAFMSSRSSSWMSCRILLPPAPPPTPALFFNPSRCSFSLFFSNFFNSSFLNTHTHGWTEHARELTLSNTLCC